MRAGSPRQLRAWAAPLQLPPRDPLGVSPAGDPRAGPESGAPGLPVAPALRQAQGLTMASRLIGGAADGADWSPAGTWAALREQKRLGGEGPAQSPGRPPGQA